jgi:hypothetical protein
MDEAAQAAERARLEYEEEARREAERAAGTPVTPESYAAWWARFSAETGGGGADVAAAPSGAHAAGDKPKRLTGRRFFETRGEAAAASEDEAEGEVPPEEEEEEGGSEGGSDEEDEEDDDDEWDPDALGCVAPRLRSLRLLQLAATQLRSDSVCARVPIAVVQE